MPILRLANPSGTIPAGGSTYLEWYVTLHIFYIYVRTINNNNININKQIWKWMWTFMIYMCMYVCMHCMYVRYFYPLEAKVYKLPIEIKYFSSAPVPITASISQTASLPVRYWLYVCTYVCMYARSKFYLCTVCIYVSWMFQCMYVCIY